MVFLIMHIDKTIKCNSILVEDSPKLFEKGIVIIKSLILFNILFYRYMYPITEIRLNFRIK